jgi:hypothetical protein
LRRRRPNSTGCACWRRAVSTLEHSRDLELTYTSNAIEGNTLTAVETTLVIEQGITVAGKPLRDHLAAIDLYEAIRYVRGIARHAVPLTELDIRNLSRLVMLRSKPDIAGRYADQGRIVLTGAGRHAFPSPVEVPVPMDDFAGWLGQAPDTPEPAFAVHRRLVDLHPFNDGNGRKPRLLMNLVLIRGRLPAGCGAPRGPAGLSDRPAGAAGQGGRRGLRAAAVSAAGRKAGRNAGGAAAGAGGAGWSDSGHGPSAYPFSFPPFFIQSTTPSATAPATKVMWIASAHWMVRSS